MLLPWVVKRQWVSVWLSLSILGILVASALSFYQKRERKGVPEIDNSPIGEDAVRDDLVVNEYGEREREPIQGHVDDQVAIEGVNFDIGTTDGMHEPNTYGVNTPEADTPEADTPEVDTPEVDTPKVDITGVNNDEVDTVEVDNSQLETAQVDFDKVDTDKIDLSADEETRLRSLEELLDLGFAAKQAGRFALAAQWFEEAFRLCLEPSLAVSLLVDIHWLWKTVNGEEVAQAQIQVLWDEHKGMPGEVEKFIAWLNHESRSTLDFIS